MHAVAALSASLVGLVHVAEPYFEDEALSEVGYVFESIVSFSDLLLLIILID